jgi:hypothetical protein
LLLAEFRNCHIFAVLLLMAITSPARAERSVSNADGVTREMVDALRNAYPDASFEIAGSLSIKAKNAANEESQINLDRVEAFCALNAKAECDDMKQRFVSGLREALQADADRITTDHLRAVLRANEYVAGAAKIVAQKEGNRLVYRTYAENLSLVLVADYPTTTRLVGTDQLKDVQLTEGEALELGKRQIVANLPHVPALAQIGGQVLAFSGSDYLASIMLAAGWDDLAAVSAGKLFVAVPGDNFALVGLVDDGDSLKQLQAYVKDRFAAADRGVSPLVYRRRVGEWIATKAD